MNRSFIGLFLAASVSSVAGLPFSSNNVVTLQCIANGNYVTLQPASLNMAADRTNIDVLQQFRIFDDGSGSYGIKAVFNGEIISADGAGTVPLIANRTAVGPWEQFNLVSEGGNIYAIQALVNSNFVTAASGNLIATQTTVGDWEKFIIQTNTTVFNPLRWRVVQPPLATNEIIVAACTPQDYGAKGDGVSDDSGAFQDAANAIAALGGGVIFVPAGFYAFYTNLNIPDGVTLHGDWQDWTTNSTGAVGTIFKVFYGAGQTNATPFIFLNGSTGLKGVSIWYPNQNAASITGYPFSIGLSGDCVVQNVVLVNSYQGIQVAPPTSAAKHIFSTVIGSPLYKGIDLDMIADISHAEDIRFSPDVWPASLLPGAPAAGGPHAAWMRANGTGMRLLRVDGEVCMNINISGYKVGIEANSSTNGVPGATFYSGSVSNCATALLAQEMSGQSGLQFTEFTLDGDIAVNRTNNTDDVTVGFDDCQITGRNGTAVYSTGADWHSWMPFQNCTISGTLQLDDGVFDVVNSSLTVPQGSNHCILNAGATRAAFVGCDFSPARSIANLSGNTNDLIVDGRHAIPNLLPNVNWADIKQDYLSRKPAKTNLFIVTSPPWNATGNGTNDDTAAIQSALNSADTNGGGIVFLPGGKYHLTNTLDVPGGVELRGPYEMRHRTWPGADGHAKGSVLQPYGGQGSTNGLPAIALEANSGLVGVTISYETQNSNAIAFPPTIQGRGGNVYAIGVVCPNPYYYVDLDTYTCTNHLIYMVDGWALKTGYCVGNGSSGSLVNCMGNWTYWWDNYDSASDLNFNPSWKDPILNFVEHNLEMYVLGNCTELLVKDFVIPSHTFIHFISENGSGPNVTAIDAMCDETGVGFDFAAGAPCNVNVVNPTMAVFADYPDLSTNTVGVIGETNFQGTVRFFNSALFGGPYWDFIVGGGDIGFEIVHMLDHAFLGSRVDGGVFHLINNGAYITYTNGIGSFPTYNITFGAGAGIAGKISEIIGGYALNGYSYSNPNTNNPVLAWANFSLATLNPLPPHELTPPQLQFNNSGSGLKFSWPGDIGYFGLYETANLKPPVVWTTATNTPFFSSNQWTMTLPALNSAGCYYRLQTP